MRPDAREPVDIGPATEIICDALAIKRSCVARLDIYPGRVEAELFRENEAGRKFVDRATGEPAMDYRLFFVRA